MNYEQGEKVTVTFLSGREHEGTVLSDQGREVFVEFPGGAVHRAPKSKVSPGWRSSVFDDALKSLEW